MLYLPLTPLSRDHSPNFRTNESGISTGHSRHGRLYAWPSWRCVCHASANWGIANRLRFTRQVESSMISATGTRLNGLRIVTPTGPGGGRSPVSCDNTVDGSDKAAAAPAPYRRNRLRVKDCTAG